LIDFLRHGVVSARQIVQIIPVSTFVL